MFRKNKIDEYVQLFIPCLTNGEVDKFLERISGTEYIILQNQILKEMFA